ncbi:MAG: hypothetical protein NTV98_01730 [Candidatus Roizmanbacteria bacterium]|nr:hypothetical protein [Candidatus Roizmanbacteria bacterium]
MIIFSLFAFCFFSYLFILVSLPVQIFPEFFFYPWLVSKGLVQYLSFFDHHGFLTSILLAPFSQNLFALSSIFVATQLIQFAIIAYLVARKIKRPLLYFLILILYLSFQFAVVQQQLWYDAGMAFFLVVAWLFFEIKREHFTWLFVALATMIKPTAFLFLIPVFLKSTRKKSIAVFLLVWDLAIVYFISLRALDRLWKQMIVFNYSYIQSTYKTFFLGIQLKLLLSICVVFALLLLYLYKRKYKNIPLLLMMLISFTFFFQGLSKLNFALFVPFFVLLIADVLNTKKIRRIVWAVLIIFSLILVRDAYKTFKDNQKRQVYLSASVIKEAKQVGSLMPGKNEDNVLVVGNRVELYYYLDALPREFTPLHFPWVQKIYNRPLDFTGIQYIVIPKKMGEYEGITPQVKKELTMHFKQSGQTASYTIWRYNKE